MNFSKKTLFSALILVSSQAFGADLGLMLKADTLRAEPFADAKTSATLNRGDQVEIKSKQGAWLNITAGSSTGWVRLLSVKRNTSGAKGTSSSDILALASGRSGTGQVVSTTGVRGLSEEELKNAKFDEGQIKQMEANTVSAQQGQQFAKSGGLKAIQFDELPAATN